MWSHRCLYIAGDCGGDGGGAEDEREREGRT